MLVAMVLGIVGAPVGVRRWDKQRWCRSNGGLKGGTGSSRYRNHGVEHKPTSTRRRCLPAKIDSQVSYAVFGKTLDAARQEGASLVALISSGPQPGIRLSPRRRGWGALLDTTA